MRDRIIDVLLEELCEVYCYSCDGEYCENCNRKEIGWGISRRESERIADRILSGS